MLIEANFDRREAIKRCREASPDSDGELFARLLDLHQLLADRLGLDPRTAAQFSTASLDLDLRINLTCEWDTTYQKPIAITLDAASKSAREVLVVRSYNNDSAETSYRTFLQRPRWSSIIIGPEAEIEDRSFPINLNAVQRREAIANVLNLYLVGESPEYIPLLEPNLVSSRWNKFIEQGREPLPSHVYQAARDRYASFYKDPKHHNNHLLQTPSGERVFMGFGDPVYLSGSSMEIMFTDILPGKRHEFRPTLGWVKVFARNSKGKEHEINLETAILAAGLKTIVLSRECPIQQTVTH